MKSSIYKKYLNATFDSLTIFDKFYFGSYEQDNISSNGSEDISWIILSKQDDRVLVISEYALDCKQYDTNGNSITWGQCSLREWLNGTFMDKAFSDEEEAKILSTTVTADRNPKNATKPGKDTKDQIFLLSITEAEKYLSANNERRCKPTAYAISEGASVNDDNDNCWWWLRSPGRNSNLAANVSDDGSVNYTGNIVDHGNGCVRPAMWIDLDN